MIAMEETYEINPSNIEQYKKLYTDTAAKVNLRISNSITIRDGDKDVKIINDMMEIMRKGYEGNIIDIQGIPVNPESSYNYRKNLLCDTIFIASDAQLEALLTKDFKLPISVMSEDIKSILGKNSSVIRELLRDEVLSAYIDITAGHPSQNIIVNVVDFILKEHYSHPGKVRDYPNEADRRINSMLHINSSSGGLTRIGLVNEEINSIKERHSIIMNDEFMNKIAAEYDLLFNRYGNIRDFSIAQDQKVINGLSIRLDNTDYLIFYSNIAFYTLKDQLDAADIKDVKCKMPKVFKKSNANTIIDALYSSGNIFIDKKCLEQQITRLEDRLMLSYYDIFVNNYISESTKKAINSIVKDKTATLFDRIRFINGPFKGILEEHVQWTQLKQVLSNEKITDYMPSGMRLRFMKCSSEDNIIKEILHRLDDHKLLQMYKEDFPKFLKYYSLQSTAERSNILSYFEMQDPELFENNSKLAQIREKEEESFFEPFHMGNEIRRSMNQMPS